MISELEAARLHAALARWSLTDARPVAETATSWVLRVTSPRGRHALKLLKPYGADEIEGARLMRYWNGDGAARIEDIHDLDVLMEWLAGETLGDWLRADYGRDAAATDILCDVLAALHRSRSTEPPLFTSLDDWFAKLANADLGFLPLATRPLWRRAQAILADLLATTTSRCPLHGDLHHDNVIGAAGHWRAIDPKGLFGDPVFDAANIFRNPYGGDVIVLRAERIDGLTDRLAQRFAWQRQRILHWAAALTAISAIWNRDSGNGWDWELGMLPLLLDAIDRSK